MATGEDDRVQHLHTASQRRGKEECTQGKVGEVRQQFQVHEDGALAYKIHSEEIQNHVSRNREERKSVRDNIKTAKETFLEEVKYAGVLPESSVAEIEQKRWLAEELHRRVEEQENFERAKLEEQERKDEEIALEFQREEEQNLRYWEYKRQQKLAKAEEEHRRLKKILRDLEKANLSDEPSDEDQEKSPEEKQLVDDLLPTPQVPESTEIITLADGTVIDAKQNEVQTEEQKKLHMQRRDEELAKVLQEQEDQQLERQKSINDDLRKAIELQDREIAKHLQRKEKAKAERRREKMRRGQSLPERDELMAGNRRHLPTYHEALGVDELERDRNGIDHAKPDTPDQIGFSERRSKSLGERNTKPHRSRSQGDDDLSDPSMERPIERRGDPRRAPLPLEVVDEGGAHYTNIVETLDPTYRRARRPLPPGTEEGYDEDDDHQSGNRSAQMVPPLKRKSSKDKSKRDKECKQQ